MNTFQLQCFLAVAEYLSFAQAAQHLHVTHPAVSQQIQSLEKELNTRLFQRTTRSVTHSKLLQFQSGPKSALTALCPEAYSF